MLILSIALVAAQPLAAAPQRFDIPSGPLLNAIEAISTRAGISVGGLTPLINASRSHPVHGRMTAAQALQKMIAGTGLEIREVGDGSYRLFPARLKVNSATIQPHPRTVAAASVSASQDVVVVGTKRKLSLRATGGDAEIVQLDASTDAPSQQDLTGLTSQVPSLSSTHLGRGRDKLFIRGIADSSFSGGAQSTVGEYLGEQRLNFNAADPGLLLLDVDRVEILKGPQGTLYGAGTLGGVVRIIPNSPDLGHATASLEASTTVTQNGDPGTMLSATVNLPVVDDRLAIRALAYRSVGGGYIDDVERGLSNVNRSVTTGGRVVARMSVGEWQIDLNEAFQRVAARDSQYADGKHSLNRASAVAQPFGASFDTAGLEVKRAFDGIDLVSATSGSRSVSRERFDASSLSNAPLSFLDGQRIHALSHETRISRVRGDESGWLIGVALLAQRNEREQTLSAPLVAGLNASTKTTVFSGASFGQYSYRSGKLLFTVGARIDYEYVTVHASVPDRMTGPQPSPKSDLRALPMAQILWFASPQLALSAGYREGYRAGGVELVRSTNADRHVLGTFFDTFKGDHLRTADLNSTFTTRGASPLSISATLSGTAWNNFQGDFLDLAGLSTTSNGGPLYLANLDVAVGWKPTRNINFSIGASLTKNLPVWRNHGLLPNIPLVAMSASLAWSHSLSSNWSIATRASASYRSHSNPGNGDLDTLETVTQGDVLSTSLSASLSRGHLSASLTLENVANDRASLFSYGNPFTFTLGEGQTTPQRPRNLTFGIHADF